MTEPKKRRLLGVPGFECVILHAGNTEERGKGATTRQMEGAPKNAVFIWHDRYTGYAVLLAEKLGRSDLKIVSPAWLRNGWRGLSLTGIVVDHAASLTLRQRHLLGEALIQVRRNHD